MKYALILIAISTLAWAGERKPLPGQAGNDDIEFVGTLILDPSEITQLIGYDMGAGYVIVKIKVTPKTEKPLAIGPGDFTMISSKDGQRSEALSPGQIAGPAALVLKPAANQPGGVGTVTNGPVWGGVLGGTGIGNSHKTDSGAVEAKPQPTDPKDSKESPLLTALKAKVLPDVQTKDPVEGLLYFPIDGKIKPKDLRVLYKGPAGRLTMEFANPK